MSRLCPGGARVGLTADNGGSAPAASGTRPPSDASTPSRSARNQLSCADRRSPTQFPFRTDENPICSCQWRQKLVGTRSRMCDMQ